MDAPIPLDAATRNLLQMMSAAPPLHSAPLAASRIGMRELSIKTGPAPAPVGAVEQRRVPGAGADIGVRIYWPAPRGAGKPRPLLLHYHGGGFVLGDLDSHDGIARYYCRHADAIVVSVDYRLAPEAKFPVPIEDCYAACRWAAEHASELGADPRRMAVTGDSAGGNASAVVAQLARARGGPALAYQALVYPAVRLDTATDYPSRRLFGGGEYFLSVRDMEWVTGLYLNNAEEARDPRASPLLAPDLSGLPPALVLTAACDVLRDEGVAYAERLRAAGVAVEHREFAGMIHGFLSFAGAVPMGMEALAWVAGRLHRALHGP
jgi:acetyl esterase